MRKLKPVMLVKRTKYRQTGWRGRPVNAVTTAGIGRSPYDVDREVLSGMIGDMKASAPEERFARALDKFGLAYQFRLALGGARNSPGFFELDFLVPHQSLYHAVEIDSLFSHRDKVYKDRLHDAMVLKELEYLGMFPVVKHFDMDRDLTSQEMTDRSVKLYFGLS